MKKTCKDFKVGQLVVAKDVLCRVYQARRGWLYAVPEHVHRHGTLDQRIIAEFCVRPADAMPATCEECYHLNPTEAEQEFTYQQGRIRQPHFCNKYGVKVHHVNAHPKILRCSLCLKEGGYKERV